MAANLSPYLPNDGSQFGLLLYYDISGLPLPKNGADVDADADVDVNQTQTHPQQYE